MKHPILIRYLALSFGIVLSFKLFIACGSQLYQVSMDEDFEVKEPKLANPDMNNPESETYGIHSLQGWPRLPIPFKIGSDMNEEQRGHLYAAMQTWERAVGKKLFSFNGIDPKNGDAFDNLYSSLTDEVNGDYLDNNWGKTHKPSYVLATTIWHNGVDPNTVGKADIRFNSEWYMLGDSLKLTSEDEREVVDMQSLALHELGHLLGLAHINSDVDMYSIMNSALYVGEGLISRKLSRGDIERIQKIYGCEGKACDIDALMEDNEFNQHLSKPIDPATNLHLD